MIHSPRTRSHRLIRLLAVLCTSVLLAAGCGSSDDEPGSAEPVTITVVAAASLTDPFNEIAEMFEDENEGVTVQLSFGGSATLVEQVLSGAPADVFASADENSMEKLGDEAVDPKNFASNTLQIAVPPGNPADVESFEDLADKDINLVICAPKVPCGAATQQIAKDAEVTLNPVSLEQSVTDVLGKVASGEADAGVVYQTDVAGADGAVEGIEFIESHAAVNIYPIAQVAGSDNEQTAQQFIELVLSAAGQKVLSAAGFGRP